MTHLLLPDEEEGMEKINIDELFEKNHNKDLKQLSLFKKLLNRIHNRIKITSRTKRDQHIFFTVPEYIFGLYLSEINTIKPSAKFNPC